MRIRPSLIGLLLLLAPLALQASRPTIIVNGDPPDPIPVTSPTFSFGANGNGGGFFSFINKSGMNWFDIDVKATLPFNSAVVCGPGPFVTCTVSITQIAGTNNFAYDIFFGPSPNVAIANGAQFSVDLNNQAGSEDPNGVGSWGANSDFTASPNAPEPASLFLTLAGTILAGGLVFLRRRAAAA